MIGLLQRVREAAVTVDSQVISSISVGLLVLVGVQLEDGPAQVERLLERILTYRLFPDAEGRMNLSLKDIQGGLLLVPQFTLAADTRKGARAGFSTAAEPARAQELFDLLIEKAKLAHPQVGSGRFGADMLVSLVNDGPVTFWIEAR